MAVAGSMNLDISNIMTPEDIDGLFEESGKVSSETSQDSQEKEEGSQPSSTQNEKSDDTQQIQTAEVSPDELFDSSSKDPSESVGSGNTQDKGGQSDSNGTGTSPKPNFYSSTASALKEDGVLPDLEDSVIENIKTPEDLSEAIQSQVEAQLDERQKRIDAALRGGVQPSAIKQFEETLSILDNITEDSLADEGEQGETLRRQLIYNDAINRGFSKERALREVETSIEKGNDVDDAREALQSSKDFYSGKYEELVNQAKQRESEYRSSLKQQAEQFRKELLEDKQVFKGVQLDNKSRKIAYEAMTKPVAKDEDGSYLTPIQKYEHDNPLEFRKKLSVVFALTNGFEDLSGLIKGPVKKEIKSKMRQLENTFNNSGSFSGGSLRLESGVGDGMELGAGLKLDI